MWEIVFTFGVSNKEIIINIMEKSKLITTAEVAIEGRDIGYVDWAADVDLRRHGNDLVELNLQDLNEARQLSGRIEDGLSDALVPVVVFNLLGGSAEDVDINKVQTKEEILQSFAILEEEVAELKEAMLAQDKPEIMDAIVDIIVVAAGIALKEGIISLLPAAFSLACHNNLTKLTKNVETGNYEAVRVNGKIQKPEGFVPLDLGSYFPKFFKGEVDNG